MLWFDLDPEEAISRHQLQPFRCRTVQHGELLPEGEVFQPELSRGLAQRGEGVEHGE